MATAILTATVVYNHLSTGDFIKDTGPSEQIDFNRGDVLGAVLWVGLYVGLGYALHDQIAEAAVFADRLGAWAIAIVAGAFGFYLGIKVTRRQLFLRQLRIARISPEELEGMLTAREPVFIVDLRHEFDVQAEPVMIRRAVHLAPVAHEQRHAAIPRDREVVLYCS